MSIKIGLISDVHATVAPLAEALSIFTRYGVDKVYCLGDIAGYGEELDETVSLLMEHNCRTILGNHDLWLLSDQSEEKHALCEIFLNKLPPVWLETVEETRLYCVHGSPPRSLMEGMRLLDQEGKVSLSEKKRWCEYLQDFDIDVLTVGHTHQFFSEVLGKTLVINPGSSKFNHTCAILTLPERDVRFFPLSQKSPLKVWNWSMIHIP